MEPIAQDRIKEGLKYKTIVGRLGNFGTTDVTILRVTAKSVTYKVGNLDPETDRLGKYKETFNLPYEATAEDIARLEQERTLEKNRAFVRSFDFRSLSPDKLAEVVALLKATEAP